MDTNELRYKWLMECGECGAAWYSSEIETTCLACGTTGSIMLDVEDEDE